MKIQSKICVIILSLLAGLMLMGSKEIMAAKNVTINDSTFPDLYFQEYILSTVDKNGDGKLSDAERKVIKVIDVGENSEYQLELEYPPSQSMKGIEYFPNLEKLNCSGSALNELNVTKNTKLIELRCNGNQIKKLNISKNRKLARLYCQDNQLKSLSCKKNTKLTELFCGGNKIKTIDVSGNRKLTELSVSHNKIEKLNVSKMRNLTGLYASENKLTKLDVSKNTKLINLYVQNNQLKKLSVNRNKQLDTLYCNGNKIRKLDLKGNHLLQTLNCEKNELVMGNLNIAFSTLEFVSCSKQSAKIQVKRIKNGYLIPINGKNKTNVLTNLSKGEITNKGIRIKGKKIPKKITYEYNMFTDEAKKTKVTIYLKK